jgi:enterochelin esterase-like enzyme
MDPIDRYVRSVRRFLPGDRKDDIARELADNLRTRVEDKAEELGRPLNEAEQESLLREHGHPLLVAGQYRRDEGSLAFGKQLIGPLLFPFYVRVLSFNLCVAFGIISIVLVGLFLAGRPMGFTAMAEVYLGHLIAQFAFVTLGFSVLQAHLTRFPDRWDPRNLHLSSTVDSLEQPTRDRVSRLESVSQIVCLFVFGGWLEGLRQFKSMLPDRDSGGFAFGPIWYQALPFIQLLALVGIVQAMINLVRPDWTWLRSIVRVAGGLTWLAILIFLLMGGNRFVLLDGDTLPAAETKQMLENFNNWLFYNLLIAAIVSAIIILFDIRRLFRGPASPTTKRGSAVALTAIAWLALQVTISPASDPETKTPAPSETKSVMRSPEVRPDGRVVFRFRAPNAKQVFLVREGFPRLAMTRDERGIWSATTDPLTPDLYVYNIVVDGVALADPANPLAKRIVTGGHESMVRVPGPGLLADNTRNVPRGILHRHSGVSTTIGEAREYWVYTPPGYDATAKKTYPVLYLLHGVMEDETAWIMAGQAPVIFDNLLADHAIRPMLIVMPLGYGFTNVPDRIGEQFGGPVTQRKFMDIMSRYLLDELIPQVEKDYRVTADREARAIAGVSMGGAQALYIGLNHLERFSRIGSFSGALVMYGGPFAKWFPELHGDANRQLRLLWIGCGTDDFLLGVNRKYKEWLKSTEVRCTAVETPGGHTWPVWRRNLGEFASLLFQEKAREAVLPAK